ncbi:MAG: AAA family ATPase [Chloroflexota bacterium]
MILRIPADAMVVLVGPSGSGKSTLAARHFGPTEVLSSDELRAMVADDASDQTATDAAFELLHTALAMRLARRRLTVVDATSVDGWARERLLAVARQLGRPAAAIAFNLPLATCLERNASRIDRRLPPPAIRRQHARMRDSLDRLTGDGFDPILVLASPEDVEAFSLERIGS